VPVETTIGWTPPRREMIDPASELKAAAQAARDGLGTRSRFLRSQGYDPEVVDRERAEELEREASLKIAYDTNVTPAVAPVAGSSGGQPEAPVGSDVQETALNGAQIAALQQIVQSVADGLLPADSAVAMIIVAFPSLDEAEAKKIVEPAAKFKPEKPGEPTVEAEPPVDPVVDPLVEEPQET
jgi:hypothetical protein